MTDLTNLYAGWLGDLPKDFAKNFAEIGRWASIEQGQIIYCNGDVSSDLFGISRGTARMQIAMNEHEQRVGHVIGPGFWFGETEFVSSIPRIMEIEASSDMRLLKIRRSDFQQLALSYPEAWRWISLLVVQHLNIAVGAADDLMLSSSEKRLTAVLLRLSGHRLAHPSSPPIDVVGDPTRIGCRCKSVTRLSRENTSRDGGKRRSVDRVWSLGGA